jgi:hypothetical protein
MIKKDIVYSSPTTYKNLKDEKQNEERSIDDIFMAADKAMAAQNNDIVFKSKKKKKHPLLRVVLVTLFGLIVFVVGLCFFILHSIKSTYPSVKANFLTQIECARDQLIAIDDTDLTIDQYYQKKILLLFSPEDFENAINNMEDLHNISKIFKVNEDCDLTLVPKDKVDEYQKLMEEYKQAIDNAEPTASSTEEQTISE